ncbi:aa3-type cytochrome c oxidase subunit IV [Acidimangrovimonas sediminis]|nr:aa3-type cytochrome c oxidase subunit IV [Acidimangrovimonas sediminis]
MSEYQRGTMDIRSHEKTFHGFVRLAAWVAGFAICTLIFIALVNG